MGIPATRGSDFLDWLEEVLPSLVDRTEIGISKQAISKGYESLSEKQRYVLETFVVAPNTQAECTFRGCELSWDEMYDAVNSDGRCSSCQHDVQAYMGKD